MEFSGVKIAQKFPAEVTKLQQVLPRSETLAASAFYVLLRKTFAKVLLRGFVLKIIIMLL